MRWIEFHVAVDVLVQTQPEARVIQCDSHTEENDLEPGGCDSISQHIKRRPNPREEHSNQQNHRSFKFCLLINSRFANKSSSVYQSISVIEVDFSYLPSLSTIKMRASAIISVALATAVLAVPRTAENSLVKRACDAESMLIPTLW